MNITSLQYNKEEQTIQSELAMFWDEIANYLPKSKERAALGDEKIFNAFAATYPKIIKHLTAERTALLTELRKILSDENYKLEEWYSSAERPDTLTHFEANQRNMKTRNEIQARLDELINPTN